MLHHRLRVRLQRTQPLRLRRGSRGLLFSVFLAPEVGLQGTLCRSAIKMTLCRRLTSIRCLLRSPICRARKPSSRYGRLPGDDLGRLPNRCGPERVRGCRTEYAGIGCNLERNVGAMHAESREFIGETYSNAPIVTGTPPISPSAPLVSTDIKEAGLWLWQGEAPPLPAPPRPKSRDQGYLCRIMPAAGWVGWIAVPAGLALAFLAVSMTPRPDRSVSVDTPGSARSSVPSPAVTRPIDPVPPAERTEAQVDQAQVPSVPPAAKLMAQGPEPPVMKGRAQHKLSRNGRKTLASHVRERPLFPRPGVLTPPP